MNALRRTIAMFRAPHRGPLLQVLKSAVAVAATWLLSDAVFARGPAPVFGAIAALLVVQPSLNQSLTRGIERSVGVVGGVVLATLLGLAFGSHTWVILVAAAAALLLAWMLRMTPGGTTQVAISAILVLAMEPATPDYAIDRIVETLLGAVVGFGVNLLIVPPVMLAPAHQQMRAFATELAASFDRLADALVAPLTAPDRDELLRRARALHPMLHATDEAIAAARDSLTLNPRARRHREELGGLTELSATFRPIVTQLVGMTRTVSDRYDDSLRTDPTVREISAQLRRTAHDVRISYARRESGDPAAVEPPALTAQLVIAAPPHNWVLVGALVEDLRRIHENLAAA